MGRPSKYPRELRERAVRMVAEVRPDYPSEYAAMTAVAQMLGIGSPETIAHVDPSAARSTPATGPVSRRDARGGDQASEAGERRAAAGERDLEGGFGFLRGRTRPATPAIVDVHRAAQGPHRWWAPMGCRVDLRRAHPARRARSPHRPTTTPAAGSPRPASVSDERWKPDHPGHLADAAEGARRPEALAAAPPRRATTSPAAPSNGSCETSGSPVSSAGSRKRPVDADARETRPADLVDRHFAPVPHEPALGRRLHLRLDLVRVGLRRVRVRRALPPHPRLAGRHAR